MKFSNLLCIDNSNHDTWEEVLKDEADESVDDPALRGIPVLRENFCTIYNSE